MAGDRVRRPSATWTGWIRRSIRPVAIVPALAIGAACTGADRIDANPSSSAEPTAVSNLRSIGTLRDRFERDSGMVRLILLISPT